MITNTAQLQEKSDTDWIRQSLFLPSRTATGNKNTGANQFPAGSQFSYSTLAFADTSLGGNRSINPKPQFTKFADPNLPSLLAETNNFGNPSQTQTMGMGRYYAEAIDENAQRIFMQFGVPAYNSMTTFFTTFYDAGHSNMANSGQVVSGDLLYTIGKFAGFITYWAIVPELALATLLYSTVFGTAKKALANFQHRPLSKFYYMKPTMPLYWSTVTTIVNALSVNMRLVQGVDAGMASRTSADTSTGTSAAAQTGNTVKIDPTSSLGKTTVADINALSKILPDIYLNEGGGIDIRAVANRYERLSDAQERAIYKIRNTRTTDKAATDGITAFLQESKKASEVGGITKIGDYINQYMESAAGLGTGLLDQLIDNGALPAGAAAPDTSASAGIANANSQAAAATTAGQTPSLWSGLSEHLSNYADYTVAELRDGSAFVSFIVEYESHVSESFNNSTRESDIASKMNETSRSSVVNYLIWQMVI